MTVETGQLSGDRPAYPIASPVVAGQRISTAVDDITAGHPAPPVPEHLIRAAHWSAAHQGLGGGCVIPERRVFDAGVQFVELAERGLPVKDAS